MRADLLIDANEIVYKMDGTPNGYAISPQIDATILRTCHMIYQEALPILYGDNQFHFHTPGQLRHFKGKGIVKISGKYDPISYALSRRAGWQCFMSLGHTATRNFAS